MKKDEEDFQNNYHKASIRLPGWDYRTGAYYFITICTQNKISYFGYIHQDIMNHNKLGLFAVECFNGINSYKPNARVVNFVVMPNHVHALVLLENKPNTVKVNNRFGPLLPGSLSSLVNHYKGMVTRYAHINNLAWGGWQERFYDHIIRDENSYQTIYDYKSNNPRKWRLDRFFGEN